MRPPGFNSRSAWVNVLDVVAVCKWWIHHNAVKLAQPEALQEIALQHVLADTLCCVLWGCDLPGKRFAEAVIDLDGKHLSRWLRGPDCVDEDAGSRAWL